MAIGPNAAEVELSSQEGPAGLTRHGPIIKLSRLLLYSEVYESVGMRRQP